MMDSYLFTKFGVNSPNGFRGNVFYIYLYASRTMSADNDGPGSLAVLIQQS